MIGMRLSALRLPFIAGGESIGFVVGKARAQEMCRENDACRAHRKAIPLPLVGRGRGGGREVSRQRGRMRPASRPRLQRSDRGDFDQQILAHQAVDDEQRIRRKGSAGKQAREFARPIGGKFRDVLRMHEVAGEGDNVGKSRALRGERRANRFEDERALRLEIGRRLAVLVGADLAGDEQIVRSLYARDVRIRRERFRHGVGVETLDGRHGRYSHFALSECEIANSEQRTRMTFQPLIPLQAGIQGGCKEPGPRVRGDERKKQTRYSLLG